MFEHVLPDNTKTILALLEKSEDQDMPHMLKEVDWQEVKNFFMAEARRAINKFIS